MAHSDARQTQFSPPPEPGAESEMWRRVQLKNYRSFLNVQVELAPFTVVVGPNGSGKSNLSDALVFIKDVAFDAESAVARRGGIEALRKWAPTRPRDVTVTVRAAKKRAELETEFTEHSLTLRSGKGGSWSIAHEQIHTALLSRGEGLRIERTGDTFRCEPSDLLPSPELPSTTSAMLLVRQVWRGRMLSSLLNVRRYRLNPDQMRVPHVPSGSDRLDEAGANVAAAVQKLRTRPEHFDPVVRALRYIVPGLVDVSVLRSGAYLSLQFIQDQGGGREATFGGSDVSEGTLRALGILVASHQMARDELLIIEEPEVHVSPAAAGVLFDVLKEASRKGAVLVTTHSPELLDHAKREEILVCSYSSGVSKVGPMAESQREVVREGLLSVAELMRSEPLRIEGDSPAGIEPADLE